MPQWSAGVSVVNLDFGGQLRLQRSSETIDVIRDGRGHHTRLQVVKMLNKQLIGARNTGSGSRSLDSDDEMMQYTCYTILSER